MAWYFRPIPLAAIVSAIAAVSCESPSAINSPPATPTYRVATNQAAREFETIDLGDLGGGRGEAYDINDAGQVVGFSHDARTQPHPFLWTAGKMIDFGVYGGASVINARGQVAGSEAPLGLTGFFHLHAFLWDKGVMTDLGTLEGDQNSVSAGINDRGQVVVASFVEPLSGIHGFVWHRGVVSPLGTLGGSQTGPSAINNRGQVAGAGTLSDLRGPDHPFLWERGQIHDLGPLPICCEVETVAINDAGRIVATGRGLLGSHAFVWDGKSWEDIGLPEGFGGVVSQALNSAGQILGYAMRGESRDPLFPFVWNRGVFTMLGVQAVNNGRGMAINTRGDVVGQYLTDSGELHAFFWSRGKVTDLGTLGGPSSGATGINMRGEIIGWAETDASHHTHPTLWIPNHSPTVANGVLAPKGSTAASSEKR